MNRLHRLFPWLIRIGLCALLVTCSAWWAPIGPLAPVSDFMMTYNPPFRNLRHADECQDRGGCWDHERGGCVGAVVEGRALEETPRQAALGHCRSEWQDRLWRWRDAFDPPAPPRVE